MDVCDEEFEDLIRRASDGEKAAVETLFARYRDRLRQMVAFRMHSRLAARVDASDIVQESLVKASRKLSGYLQNRPLPFYPWLRQIAREQLADAHRRHVQAKKRAVGRDQWQGAHSDRSTMVMADQLLANDTSPSGHLARAESRDRMHAALASLSPRDREVLVLRHLKQLSTRDIVLVLGITEGAVKTRHLRALQRLRDLLNDEDWEQKP